MDWLQSLDESVFRFIHHALKNPIFDVLMPWFSGNKLFFPLVLFGSMALLFWDKRRAALCLVTASIAVGITDGLVCNKLKKLIQRDRPFVTLQDTQSLVGEGKSKSMPSSHAANWFAASMVAFFFYRRSWRITLPLACAVSFSRVYNGVHFPSDVIAGAILGAGTGVATAGLLNGLWRFVGRRLFPLWWSQMQRPVPFEHHQAEDHLQAPTLSQPAGTDWRERQWIHLGYVLIAVLLLGRLIFLATGRLELSEDEAYQWVWSKHPALSYFSKPPLIAYGQWLGTAIWGDNELGVRFLSPVIAGIIGFLMLRFFAREVNARTGFFLLLVLTTTPLLAVGATLFTVDALSVLFWTAAMIAGWKAVQPDASTRNWGWVGLWMALGFLSKYTALLQWVCWAVFFWLWKPARVHLRRPGPYLALFINLLGSIPVLIWNQQHGWITVEHVAHHNAGLDTAWEPTLKYLGEFLGAEFGLWNPVWFVAVILAAWFTCRRCHHDLRLIFLWSMGVPLFLIYLLFSLRSRVLPNWIAPSLVPTLALMVIVWAERWHERPRAMQASLVTGLLLGVIVILPMHNSDLIRKAIGTPLPVRLDPTRRVSGWRETAEAVGGARNELLAEGKPVFIIGSHYGITSEIAFYLPEARRRVKTDPLVFYRTTEHPVNQYYFWPGYQSKRGENAIYVTPGTKIKELPESLVTEFESISGPEMVEVKNKKSVVRTLQIYRCLNLR